MFVSDYDYFSLVNLWEWYLKCFPLGWVNVESDLRASDRTGPLGDGDRRICNVTRSYRFLWSMNEERLSASALLGLFVVLLRVFC